ncbi:unnamed protein product [Closterium sp. Yama58-4]|nr:unnamed protein product [Closterium sp. Yama58-4]
MVMDSIFPARAKCFHKTNLESVSSVYSSLAGFFPTVCSLEEAIAGLSKSLDGVFEATLSGTAVELPEKPGTVVVTKVTENDNHGQSMSSLHEASAPSESDMDMKGSSKRFFTDPSLSSAIEPLRLQLGSDLFHAALVPVRTWKESFGALPGKLKLLEAHAYTHDLNRYRHNILVQKKCFYKGSKASQGRLLRLEAKLQQAEMKMRASRVAFLTLERGLLDDMELLLAEARRMPSILTQVCGTTSESLKHLEGLGNAMEQMDSPLARQSLHHIRLTEPLRDK